MNDDTATFELLRARVAALLAALGDTPNTVADTLLAGGCFGVRGATQACPVAVYLLRSDLQPRPDIVAVYGDFAWLQGAGMGTVEAPIPTVVDQFINDFDAGKYPDLCCDDPNALTDEGGE